ncbi:related to tRNA 2`-phosphotransferase [Rhynchosporium graminicola]|uniref:2'-phosphotransferase n=1 Tax=Rhynchosporium graminicola TaxID=2792576 RepID=A0A1E1KIN9_9HELO|nr:related to tRNA 2`-phosphotransferase [Rhynchosporium commune]
MSSFTDKAEELDASLGRGGRPEGRGGRGGKRGGGGGKGEGREVMVSKALSKLLRHAAVEAGLKLDAEGFASVEQVMKWPRLKSLQIIFDDIRTAVSDNAKQRFSMKPSPSLEGTPDLNSENPSDWVIRANQGHSIAVDSASLLVPITVAAGNVPDIVVHGTYFAFYQTIVESGGLKKMTRNHIHFSTGLPEDKQGVISGMRKDAEILIYVDVKQSLEDGVEWWLSENGVVLTEGDHMGVLGTKYWKKVEGRKEDTGVLWEEGKMVKELPEGFRGRRAPVGKGPRGQGPIGGGKGGRGRGRGRGSGGVSEEFGSSPTNEP